MPWLERRPGGYLVRWHDANGKHTSAIYPVKMDALTKRREVTDTLAATKPVRTGRDMSMGELLKRFRQRQLARGGRDLNVDKQIERIASICAARGWDSPRKITPASVEEWRQAGGSPRAGAYLRSLLRWASETLDQSVDQRTLIALRPRPLRRRPKADLATKAQLADWQAKADAISPHVGAIVHCLALYGWRPITAADLRVQDLDLKAGMITTAVKGGDIVRHPLRRETIKRLRPLVKDRPATAPLFLHPTTGKGWSADSRDAHSVARWIGAALGMKVYDLKRWAISTMLACKIEPQTVALFTGHRTISQVLTYARTNEERAREALAALG
jgi:hypothetical protein